MSSGFSDPKMVRNIMTSLSHHLWNIYFQINCILNWYFSFLFYVYEYFVCVYVYIPCRFLVYSEAGRVCRIPWNWGLDVCEPLCGTGE